MPNKQEKIDAWLHWSITNNCNLDCEYCYGTHKLNKILSIFKKPEFPKIDVSSLIKTLDNMDKIFLISFTGGGEPFLIPNLVEACAELAKKHYITVITNLTSPKIKEFAEKVNPDKVIRIIASCHIKELERLNLLDKYIENFLILKQKGFDILAYEVAYPALVNEVEKYRKFFRKKGIELRFDPFKGKYKRKKYPDSYSNEKLGIFGLDLKEIKKDYQKNQLCNAGYNAAVVYGNGDVKVCFKIKKKLGNIYKEIEFNKKLTICPLKFCGCPLKEYVPELFRKAVLESNQ